VGDGGLALAPEWMTIERQPIFLHCSMNFAADFHMLTILAKLLTVWQRSKLGLQKSTKNLIL